MWGVDLVEQHLLASSGLAAKPLIAAKPIMRLAEYSINAPVTGESVLLSLLDSNTLFRLKLKMPDVRLLLHQSGSLKTSA